MKRPHALTVVRQNSIFLTRRHRKPKVRKFTESNNLGPKPYRRDE